jgi:hypothetical protein
MNVISKIAATALAASLIVPTAFAATTHGTLASKSHVSAMKKMMKKKMMMKKPMKKTMMKKKMMMKKKAM